MTRALLLSLTLVLAGAADAGGPTTQSGAKYPTPQAGTNYRVLDPRIATDAPSGKVQVIEFFSIGCPHCAEFEPYLQGWLKTKPANVTVLRLPASFNPFFKLMGRAYYALEDVKAAEAVVPLLLDKIHSSRDPAIIRPLGAWQNATNRNDLEDAAAAEKEIAAAIAELAKQRAGADPKRFLAAWNSFSVNARLARADAMYRRYGVHGVPAIAVDGRFLATVGRETGVTSYGQLLAVTDHLIRLASEPTPSR
jgi:thiol:disulfide interchange protein DsbA